MKKTYIIPHTQVTTVNTENIIASSPMNINGNSGTGQLQNTDATGEAMTKRNDYDAWSDDWSR